jgi:predicted ABC-type transport system involved in lysophospholipase L1 biosynthesis ATPase subunit
LAIAGRRPDAEWMGLVVAALNLGHRLLHVPAELSGGEQQRVACPLLAGLAAAVIPAVRAARTNILKAIAYE